MDLDSMLDKPLPVQKPPIVNDIPGMPHSGGSCRCSCHGDQAQRLIAAGLALFGGFFYLLGIMAGAQALRRAPSR